MARAPDAQQPGPWPPWLQDVRARLEAMAAQRQVPQALLVHGVPGTGRRRLALWLAARLLGLAGEPLAHLAEAPEEEQDTELGHPDLLLVRPPPEKAAIHVEAIRDLIAFMQLTSHQGGSRVALLWPAESLTPAAANGLLKVLEEPPAGGVIVLVACAPARLPPTVLSRCQRLRVPLPARVPALAWLAAQAGAGHWDALLDFAGGAPLQALAWQRDGRAGDLAGYAADLEEIRHRRASPAAVARRWAGGDGALAARWLYLQAAAGLRVALADARHGGDAQRLQKQPKPTTMPLQRLREAEELQRLASRALATEVQLAAVLQRWYGDSQPADGKH